MRFIFAVFAVVVLLSGCTNQLDIIYVGVVEDQIASFPLRFAIEAEYFPREKVEFRTYSSEEKLFAALQKGRVDLAALPATYALLDETKSSKVLQPLQRGGGGIVASSSLESIEDLRGKVIGTVNSSNLAELSLALNEKKQMGWDIKLFPSIKSMKRAYFKGDIEAFTSSTPDIVGYAGDNRAIYWFEEDFGYYPAFSILAGKGSLELKRSLIDSYIDSINGGLEVINLYPSKTYLNFSRVCKVIERYSKFVLLHTRYISSSFPNDEAFVDEMASHKAARTSGTKIRAYHEASEQ